MVNNVGGNQAQLASVNDIRYQQKLNVDSNGKLFLEATKAVGTADKPVIAPPTPNPAIRNNKLPESELGLSPTDQLELFGLGTTQKSTQEDVQFEQTDNTVSFGEVYNAEFIEAYEEALGRTKYAINAANEAYRKTLQMVSEV